MVHTVTSAHGGVFSLIIDGINTTTFIDTFSGPGELAQPTCFPRQFPGFIVTPPGYADRSSHTISLVYIGPSAYSPANTASTVQFDGFSIPDFSADSLDGMQIGESKASVVIPGAVTVGLMIFLCIPFYVL